MGQVGESFAVQERIYDAQEYGIKLRVRAYRRWELWIPERSKRVELAVRRLFERKLGESAVIGPVRCELVRCSGDRKFPYRLCCSTLAFRDVHPDDHDLVRRFADKRRRVYVAVPEPICINAAYPTI